MNRSEKALRFYSEGFNCAQSVIVSFADIMNIDEETALRLASGFGGGMGRMQNTCGAITGAFMVIGYLRGNYKQGDDEAKEITNQLIQELSRQFVELHGTINCKALINFDLNTPEGREQAENANVFNKRCSLFVKSSVELLEKIILNEVKLS